MRQHCTDGSFRFCRWRTHTEALSEDSEPEALSTQGQYFALHVFYEIVQPLAGELSAHCCRTITMTHYNKPSFPYECLLRLEPGPQTGIVGGPAGRLGMPGRRRDGRLWHGRPGGVWRVYGAVWRRARTPLSRSGSCLPQGSCRLSGLPPPHTPPP